MWAQLMKTRLKPGQADALLSSFDVLRGLEQPGSGLVRTTVMRSQADPDQAYVLVVFESEELARAREADPRRQEGLLELRARLAEVLDGPPEFVDLDVLRETAGPD